MKSLRNASTLILVVKNHTIINSARKANDINVLALKRSKTSSSFPDSYVFPGGNCDPADKSAKWLKIFPLSELDVQLNIYKKEQCDELSKSDAIPNAVSRRITAIRETFEECGILLCKRETDNFKYHVNNFIIPDKNHWRNKIRNDAHEFYNLCSSLHCFPDIKSLHLLSNWISPRVFFKRFNNHFFIATLDHQVDGEVDNKEIQEVQWNSTNYFIRNENIFLPPPQLYEMERMQNFTSFAELTEFIKVLDYEICKPYLPVSVNTTDGVVMILPGDENYDKLKVVESEITVDLNCDTVSYRGKIMNRIEFTNVENINNSFNKAEVVISGLDDKFSSSFMRRSKL